MKRRIPKICERCQKTFICGLFGCWCSEMPVTDQQYNEIVERYHECLCPTCLSEISGRPVPADVVKLSSPVPDQ